VRRTGHHLRALGLVSGLAVLLTAPGARADEGVRLEPVTYTLFTPGRGVALERTLRAARPIGRYEILVDDKTWQTFRPDTPRLVEELRTTIELPAPGTYRVGIRVFGTDGTLVGQTELTAVRERRDAEVFAVVVGVNEVGAAAPRLRFAERDARAVAAALEKAGVRSDNLRLLAGPDATPDRLDNAFQRLSLATQPGDTLIFYFSVPSDHGGAEGGRQKASFRRGPGTLLLKAGPGEGTSRLPVLDLAWISQVLGAARSVLVLDTCLSGDFRDFAPVAKREVLVLWSGCAPESDAHQGGIFTHHLLARFPERADFGDVRRWWPEVRDAVRTEAAALGRREPFLVTGPTFVPVPEQELGSPVLGEGERPRLPPDAKAPVPSARTPRLAGESSRSAAGAPTPVDAAGQRPR